MAPPKKGGLNLGSAPPPPASKTKNLTTGGAFNQFINQHPTMRPYADQIWKWAGVYGVDKVVAAALFWKESFAAARATGTDPATIVSPKGAVGIGQIMPSHVGERTPWGQTVTQADLVNPDFNIRYAMWFFSQQVQKFGDPDSAYTKGYNPGYTGPALTATIPKTYVPRSGLSPTEQATVTAEQSAANAVAKAQVNERWAVLDKGKVKFVAINDVNAPPKNALVYGGQAMTETGFTQVWKQVYADTFQAYTGRKPTGVEVKQILADAPSVYTLANELANKSGFSKSPVYKAKAPGLVAIGKQILGNNWTPSGGLIRNAISQNWDQATFEGKLRQLPAYRQGPEFKTNLAQNRQAFETIYGPGTGDTFVQKMIADKTAAGWTPDQFQDWLRQQPAYQHSAEYQAKAVSFLSQLGLITGQVPTLTGDQVDQMANSAREVAGAPYSSAGAQQRAGVGTGGALLSPANGGS